VEITMSAAPTIGQARRRRLPNRREAVTETIAFARSNGSGVEYQATLGFDELKRPREIFLFGAKDGTDMAAVLADAAVTISIALQHGIRADSLARSVSRVSQGDGMPTLPGSVIGAALDLLVRSEPDR
jgi:hypothetical protein